MKLSIEDIDLIVYDFDGVMTDNRAMLFQDGTEAVWVNRGDGLGVDGIRKLGIRQLILSTETNPVVKARGAKLRIEVISSCDNKAEVLSEFCDKNHYELKRVLYIGNDLNDLEVMKIVGFPLSPADAHQDIKEISCLITQAKGGDGVVRELLDLLN